MGVPQPATPVGNFYPFRAYRKWKTRSRFDNPRQPRHHAPASTMGPITERLRENVRRVRERIARAAAAAGRDPAGVLLVAVTKYVGVDEIRALLDLGEREIAENRPEELVRKREVLGDAGAPATWHLVGALQTRKARDVAPWVDRYDALGRLREAEKLAPLRGGGRPLPVLVEINIAGNPERAGVLAEDAPRLLADLAHFRDVLPVRGLMALAPQGRTPEEVRPWFARVRAVRDELEARLGVRLPDLSMGMSGDLEAAVVEGATEVRVGAALWEGIV